MSLSRLQRQTAWTGARYVLGWVLVALAMAPAFTPEWNTLDWELVVVGGLGLGVIGAAFELVAMPRFARDASPLRAALGRTVFYVAAWIAVATALLAWSLARYDGQGLAEGFARPEVQAYFHGPQFWLGVVVLVAASAVMNFGREVRLVLGPSALAALFVGRYRVPVREERAFLFLDLTDSTGIAQRLGPAEYHAFKNDFFRDVAAPILATGGQITQYVGDEVVVTWRVKNGRLARHPAETVLLLDEAVAARADRYRDRYGEVPRYKAGLHAGVVVTAEVGTLKKDLVHTGDAVNVAARVEGQCHALGARLLASEAALGLAPLPAGMESEEVGAVELRGRAGAVRLFRLLPLDAAPAAGTA
ncbi:adenylate/guanylate cyclase domain-containing protein [Rubrivirga sp. IMCC45206]|uniref:adenylate/guanylate cyclase domain-containing protein n=1 Tax=Rubrivirga sp. IMCC45206 TaxID=3391614 RepID=UPI00398FA1A9